MPKLEQILQEAKSKPDSDMILNWYYLINKWFPSVSWSNFLEMYIPMIFEMVEIAYKWEKSVKRGPKNRKYGK